MFAQRLLSSKVAVAGGDPAKHDCALERFSPGDYYDWEIIRVDTNGAKFTGRMALGTAFCEGILIAGSVDGNQYQSRDDGKTWKHMPAFYGQSPFPADAQGELPIFIYGGNGKFIAAQGAFTVWTSRNYGDTWTKLANTFPPTSTTPAISGIQFYGGDDTVIFKKGSLYYSNDLFANHTMLLVKRTTDSLLPGVGYNPHANIALKSWLCFREPAEEVHDPLYQSVDRGVSWQKKVATGSYITGLEINRYNSNVPGHGIHTLHWLTGNTWVAYVKYYNVGVGGVGDGPHYGWCISNDNGANWSTISIGSGFYDTIHEHYNNSYVGNKVVFVVNDDGQLLTFPRNGPYNSGARLIDNLRERFKYLGLVGRTSTVALGFDCICIGGTIDGEAVIYRGTKTQGIKSIAPYSVNPQSTSLAILKADPVYGDGVFTDPAWTADQRVYIEGAFKTWDGSAWVNSALADITAAPSTPSDAGLTDGTSGTAVVIGGGRTGVASINFNRFCFVFEITLDITRTRPPARLEYYNGKSWVNIATWNTSVPRQTISYSINAIASQIRVVSNSGNTSTGSYTYIYEIDATGFCSWAITDVQAGGPGIIAPAFTDAQTLISDPVFGDGNWTDPAWAPGEYLELVGPEYVTWDGAAWQTLLDKPIISVTAGAPGVIDHASVTLAALKADPRFGDGNWNAPAWAASEFVITGDNKVAFWDGAAWIEKTPVDLTRRGGITLQSSGRYSSAYLQTYAVDNNLNTRWQAPTAGADHYIVVLLGVTALITSITVDHKDYTAPAPASVTYDHWKSGGQWTQFVGGNTGTEQGKTINSANVKTTLSFDPVIAERVRVNIHEIAAGTIAGVKEIHIYGVVL